MSMYDPDYDYAAGAEALARENEQLRAQLAEATAGAKPWTAEDDAAFVERMRAAKTPEELKEILTDAGLIYIDG